MDKSSHRNEVPVLVLGTGLTSLGVVRSFGRAGIPVYCVSENLGFVAHSRWFRRPPGKIKTVGGTEELVPFLEQLPFDKVVLMPCADNWVSAVASVPNNLRQKCLVSQPSRAVLDLLVDKGRFATALKENDIPHPATELLDSEERFSSIAESMFSGSFLKPHNSQVFHQHYGVKACRVSSREDAIAQYRHKTQDGLEVLFQEYVPGPASNHYFIDGFVDKTGSVRAIFARRRLRMYPVDFGNSTYMRSIELDEVADAVEGLKRFLAAIAYRGIFSAEFKFDHRDNLFKILEINARPWWFVEYAARCGVDVCQLAYRDAQNLPVPHINGYRVGVKSVHPYFDVNICMELCRKGEMSLLSWFRSWAFAQYPVLCYDDPLPCFNWWRRKLAERAKKAVS